MLGSFHCSARANSIASECCGRLEEFLLAHWVDRLWVCLVLPVVQKRWRRHPISVELDLCLKYIVFYVKRQLFPSYSSSSLKVLEDIWFIERLYNVYWRLLTRVHTRPGKPGISWLVLYFLESSVFDFCLNCLCIGFLSWNPWFQPFKSKKSLRRLLKFITIQSNFPRFRYLSVGYNSAYLFIS